MTKPLEPHMEALARRAVACKGWRLKLGAQIYTPEDTADFGRVVGIDTACPTYSAIIGAAPDTVWAVVAHWETLMGMTAWGMPGERDPMPPLPDLTDPATIGCLLALVREAYLCPEVSVYHVVAMDGFRAWRVTVPASTTRSHPLYFDDRTEARALVLALEHAP